MTSLENRVKAYVEKSSEETVYDLLDDIQVALNEGCLDWDRYMQLIDAVWCCS